MKRYNVNMYLAGHDHSLQFLDLGGGLGEGPFQIVSGSAGKKSSVRPNDKGSTHFAHGVYGFVRFDVTEQAIWIEFLHVNVKEFTHKSSAVFRIPQI